MAKPKRTPPPDALPGENELGRIYGAGGAPRPSEALDKKILAAARRATGRSGSGKPFMVRWAAPLSTAAVVVLAIGTTLLMTREGALNHRAEMAVSGEYDAAPALPPASQAPPLESRKFAKSAEPAAIAEPVAPAAPAKRAATKKEAQVTTMSEAKTKSRPAAAPVMADRVGASRGTDRVSSSETARGSALATAGVGVMNNHRADVVAVRASGSPGAYSFRVTVRSPDTGCEQYADWWEVLSEDGTLLYRRVLFHSHVGEQPFTRDGGPVPVLADAMVWVRAHMNKAGYGGVALKGNVNSGFKPAALDATFAAGAATLPPLPDGCAF